MFGPLSLLLSLSQPVLAADEAEPTTAAIVGDVDAAGKKKSEKRAPTSPSAPAAAPARGAPAPAATPHSSGAPRPASAPRSRPVDTERGSGTSSPRPSNQRRPSAPGAEAAKRSSGESASHEEAASRHTSADHESADRHRSADHSSADRASTSHHRSADTSHRSAAPSRAAERHRAARHAYASHHAAWTSHHARAAWYRPWRAGHPVYWYHGVFVYGPPVVYVDGGHVEPGHRGGGGAPAPKRSVTREGKFSLGFTGGSYLSGFHDGSGYGDAGLGINAAYRPIEPLAFQLSWSYHDASWTEGSARVQQPLQASVELFAFPWSRVSPYVLAGVTVTDRNLDQPLAGGPSFESEDSLWGPHGGVGIEFALGKSVALDFDARFIGYVNKPVGDPSSAGAIQANMGLNFYF